MAITLTDDQLPALLESIQGNPQLSSIRGEILSKLSSVITDYDFIVDSWPEYKAVVVPVNPQRAKFRSHLGRIVSAYTKDKHVLEKLLRTPGILDWSYNSSPIPGGCMVTKIRPEQASIVNATFMHRKGKETEDYINHILERLPSCCMYNKERDLVGYAVQYPTRELGMLYVFEKERRKGYGKVIVSHLAASCLKQEKEVSVIVKENNTSSIRLHESIGFQKVPLTKCDALWLEN